ncbi:MAG: tetratricopeptide repeat protein [Flavobacterium sp.]|nr:tetratricopeptide repeat protein [Flavobacterium sp.]
MKFYNLLIKYRFWLSIVAIVGGILLQLTGLSSFWPVFPLYFIGVVGLVSHFVIGPMRIIQVPMEAGNIEEVERILNSIWYPNLLYKPVRSTYYTIKGNVAMMKQDFDSAEKFLKQSNHLGSPMPDAQGSNNLQLGMMAMQKGDLKQGESYVRAALRLGLSDKESLALAYLTMTQVFINKRQFKAAKDFFRKAKECKAKSQQIIDQIKDIEKYISRMPN